MTAIVHRIDYSKILKISPSYGSTAAIIRALSEHDRKQSSDFNKVSYHHGKNGFYLKFYNSSQGFVIYDKFEEICADFTLKQPFFSIAKHSSVDECSAVVDQAERCPYTNAYKTGHVVMIFTSKVGESGHLRPLSPTLRRACITLP